MRLPNAERAIVDPSKIRDYLLSASHPIGRFKAVFFRSLGYQSNAWEGLAHDLHAHARSHPVYSVETTEFGYKYEVRGILKGPSGRTAEVITVWIMLNDEDSPRFVTAIPG